MDWYMLVLRLVHIPSGVLWVRGSLAFLWFVGPAVGAAGPEGGKVMRELVLRTRWVLVVSLAAGLTTLSGLLMYWRDSGGLRVEWIQTGMGLMLTIGGLAGLVAAYFGPQVGQAGKKLAELGERVAMAGGPPSAEDQAEMGRLQEQMQSYGSIAAVLLVIAVLTMAGARYVTF